MATVDVRIGIVPTLQGGKQIFLLGAEQGDATIFVDMTNKDLHARLLRLASLNTVCVKPKRDSNALVVKAKSDISPEAIKDLSRIIGSVFDCSVEFGDALSEREIVELDQEQNLGKICPRRKR